MPTINVNQANASETTKGIVEEATQAEVNAGTDTGGTGAQLFVPPSKYLAGILAKVLTGFVAGANVAVAASDTLAQALAKFQGQINGEITARTNADTNETNARIAADALLTPMSRTLTINGTAQDLSANRSWTISTGGYTYVATSSTPYAASSGDYIDMDASGGNKVVTPPASGFFAVRMAVGSGSNTVTVTGLDVLYIVGDVVEYIWNGAAFIKVSDGRKLHSGILERTTVQSITSATQVKILHNVAGTDYGGVTDLANSRFVVRRAARVQMGMYGGMNVDDTEFLAHELWLNGARILNGSIRNSTTAGISFSVVNQLDVVAGDILEHYYQHGDATEDCLIGINRPIFTFNEIRLI